jgi:hypothetical protein
MVKNLQDGVDYFIWDNKKSAGGGGRRTKREVKETIRSDDLTVRTTNHLAHMFCGACNMKLFDGTVRDMNSLCAHVTGSKHSKALAKRKERRAKDVRLDAQLDAMQPEDCTSVSLEREETKFRIELITVLAAVGIAPSKVEKQPCGPLRRLLEGGGISTGGPNGLRAQINPARKQALAEVKAALDARICDEVSISFDGTTADGEAMTIAVRYWERTDQKERRLVTKCVGFHLLAESMKGEAIAFELNGMIRAIGLEASSVVCAARDRAAPNTVAIEALQVAYENMLDVKCISHTLDDIGSKINVEFLRGFVDRFVAIFKNSAAARRAFRKLVTGSKTSYSRTRWGGFRDIADGVVYTHFSSVKSFLLNKKYGFCVETRDKAREYFLEHEREILEEAILIHYTSKGVYDACYKLEGDGPAVVIALDELLTAWEGMDTLGDEEYQSNMAQSAGIYGDSDAQRRDALDANAAKLEPAKDYFTEQIGDLSDPNADAKIKSTMDLCRAARYFHPPAAADVCNGGFPREMLNKIPALRRLLPGLEAEMPKYLSAIRMLAMRHPGSHKLMDFFWTIEDEAPIHVQAFMIIALHPASSAAAERIFSFFNNLAQHADGSLDDMLELGVVAGYNSRPDTTKPVEFYIGPPQRALAEALDGSSGDDHAGTGNDSRSVANAASAAVPLPDLDSEHAALLSLIGMSIQQGR